jgi:hypothetical protein
MADDSSIQSFQDFVKSLSSQKLETRRAKPEARVESAEAVEAMRQYLLNLYQGIDAHHTFLDGGDQIIDCIPIEQQPALKGSGKSIATPPPALPPTQLPSYPAPDFDRQPRPVPPPQLSPDAKDKFGNQMWCPAGTIPIPRLTLEQLSRFRSLQDFFQKAPGGGRLPTGIESHKKSAALESTHKYAHALQLVNNVGGTGALNVWKPVIGPNQVFSLSQHWYVGGSDAGLQTAECGWQVFPQKYNTDEPCLFIYWTADDYQNTGCYNMDCSAFVQTNSSIVLGGTLAFSTPGPSTQFEYTMGFFFSDGNWWFYLNNQAVGYYPGSLYRGGALSSGNATVVDFGGETVGTGTWPPMGSGAFASAGFGQAAYQRAIQYYPPSGGVVSASLSMQQPSPQCYTIQITSSSDASWGTYFFFGGPGGTNC